MIGVRPMEAADIPAVLAMARTMHAEAPAYNFVPFEDERLNEWFALVLGHDDWLCVLAVDEEAGPIGFLAVGCVPMIFSIRSTCDDVGLYVARPHRGTTAALRLLRYVEQWAKAKAVVSIRIGVTTGTNNAQAVRFLERFGFKATGTLMTKPCLSIAG